MFTLGKSKQTIGKNDSFDIILGSTGLNDGTLVPYTISGIDATDINEPLAGNFTVNNNAAVITITTTNLTTVCKLLRLDLNNDPAYIEIVFNQDDDFITDPCHVFPSDTFDIWRKKHNGICHAIEIASQVRGVKKFYLNAETAGQSVFQLSEPVNIANSLVSLNGNILDITDYNINGLVLTYLSSDSYQIQVDDDLNIYDFATGGGFASQRFLATPGQTVFNLAQNINIDHTIVYVNGNALDNSDVLLAPASVTYQATNYTLVQDDVVLVVDYANGQIAGYNKVLHDEGTPLPQRPSVDFVGAGVTVTDDSGNNKTIVTIPGGAAGELNQTIMDEGVAVTDRSNIDFVGNGVSITDDAGNDKTIITITQPTIPEDKYIIQTGNFSPAIGSKHLAITTSGTIAVTLPTTLDASNDGEYISLGISDPTQAGNDISLQSASHTLNGAVSPLTIPGATVINTEFKIIWDNTNSDWKVIN